MSKLIDLEGKKFNNLVVISRAGSNRQGSSTWLCRCKLCNREITYSSDHLTRKKQPVKSCGCDSIRKGPRHSQWGGYKGISGNWWYCHILRERKQNERTRVPVNITMKYAWKLYRKQNGLCALSGIPIEIGNRYGTASIDRIDSSKGYEIGNIQWVHKHINFMKRTYNQEYFISMCKQVAKYHSGGGQCELTRV